MAYADTSLTEQIRQVCPRRGALTWATGERLPGGEESAAFRIGAQVVRIGPAWRTTAELEWCHSVALAASERSPRLSRLCPIAQGRPSSVSQGVRYLCGPT